jgi:hypothetical protein
MVRRNRQTKSHARDHDLPAAAEKARVADFAELPSLGPIVKNPTSYAY